MDLNEIIIEIKNNPEDLKENLKENFKLTTERCFYASTDALKVLF